MSAGCRLWTRKPDTAADNGVFYEWTFESDCMSGCLMLTSCLAFDLRPNGCILHNNTDDLAASYDAPGITQFILNRHCLLSTTTISFGNRIGTL